MFVELASFAFILTSIYYVFLRRKQIRTPPPTIKGSPFVGVMFQLNFEFLHLTLQKWSQRYGEIFQFKIFGTTFVSLNSCSIIRDTFLKEPAATITAAKPPTFFGKYALDNYSDIAFDTMSKALVKKRKIGYRVINAYSEGLKLREEQITAELRCVMAKVKLQDNRDLDPGIIVEDFLLDLVEILVRCMLY